MSAFTASAEWCEPVGATGYYRVTDPVIWEVGAKGSGLFVVVQRGIVFDISVPACLRWFLSPHDRRVLKAAALHDYLLGLGWDRVTAAAAFHDALAAAGVGWLRRLLLWLTVSLWKWR